LNTEIYQNYPNPFNAETFLPLALSKPEHVVITICDPMGRLVRKLNLGYKKAGYYLDRDKAAYWDGKNDEGEVMPSGLYFYLFDAGNIRTTKKIILLK